MHEHGATLGRRAPFIRRQDDGDRDKCREVAENSDIRAAVSAADAAFVSTTRPNAAQFFPRASVPFAARAAETIPLPATFGATLTASLP
jgi:hypothetical protein